jgi:hypothetical protein
MLHKDPFATPAKDYLGGALKAGADATKILANPKNSKDAKKKAAAVERKIQQGRADAHAAVEFAEKYRNNATKREVRDAEELLQKARDLAATFDDTYKVIDAFSNPESATHHRNVADAIVHHLKKEAIDELFGNAVEALLNYATSYAITGLVNAITNLPPGTGAAANWLGRAGGELVDHLQRKLRDARSGVDPLTGDCAPTRPCHNCTWNNEPHNRGRQQRQCLFHR